MWLILNLVLIIFSTESASFCLTWHFSTIFQAENIGIWFFLFFSLYVFTLWGWTLCYAESFGLSEKMGVETGWVMCIDFVPRKVKIFSLGPGFQLLIWNDWFFMYVQLAMAYKSPTSATKKKSFFNAASKWDPTWFLSQFSNSQVVILHVLFFQT